MTNWAKDILSTIEEVIDRKNFRGLKICKVKTANPLVFTYDGTDIGTSLGDKVYVHPLFTADLIELDIESINEAQTFDSTTAYNSPSFTGVISGTLPNFLRDFYLFYKNWQSVYNLNPGDSIVVWETGDGVYTVLQKVTEYVVPNEGKEEDNEL